jgi:hypothetical protein
MITLRQILDYMATGQPFSLRVVAYDRRRRTGGAILHYPEAVLVSQELAAQAIQRPLTRAEATHTLRAQRHGLHFTRNIRILQQGQPTVIIRKIHIPLIIEFNGDTQVVD